MNFSKVTLISDSKESKPDVIASWGDEDLVQVTESDSKRTFYIGTVVDEKTFNKYFDIEGSNLVPKFTDPIQVKTKRGWNFLKPDGTLLSPQFFKYAYSFINGYAIVKTPKGLNFLKPDGTLLSSQFFKYAWAFKNGFALVETSQGWNFLKPDGTLLSSQFFEGACDFYDGYAPVWISKQWKRINTEGEIVDSSTIHWTHAMSLIH